MFRFLVWMSVCVATSFGGWTSRAAQDDDRLVILGKLIRDPSPRVRVEALRALARIPTAESARVALQVMDLPMDPTLDYALWLTINDLAEPWMTAVLSGEGREEGSEEQWGFVLKALKPEQASRVLGALLGGRPLPSDGSGPWIDVLKSAGGPGELRRLLDQAREGGLDPSATARVLKALREAARLRQVRPEGDLSVLGEFLRSPSPEVRLEACQLAGFWKDIGSATTVLAGIAEGADTEENLRAAAFEALGRIGGTAGVEVLRRQSHQGATVKVRGAAAVILASLDSDSGIPAILSVAGALPTEEAAVDFWRRVLSVKGMATSLREALIGQTLSQAVARAGMRVGREGGRDDVELVAAFAGAGGLVADTRELEAQLMLELAGRALTEGDPDRGERVYRRPELACTTCHAIGGAGGLVGPDLTSIGASAPVDYLVEALLLPSAKIKEGYASILIETRDGEEVTGTLARETPEEVFLRDATGREVGVPKAGIAERRIGRLSLMPSGLMEPLSEQERLDLWAFLGRLGKPGDFDASRGGVARRWRIANVVHTDFQNDDGEWFWKKPLEDSRWIPALSRVRGDLPRDVVEAAAKAQAWTSKIAVVLATEIDLALVGPVRFRLEPETAELWLEGRRLDPGSSTTVTLEPGRHRVIVRLDPRHLPETVRLEAEGATFVLN